MSWFAHLATLEAGRGIITRHPAKTWDEDGEIVATFTYPQSLYQAPAGPLLSSMQISTVLTEPYPSTASVDFRAARPAEIREIEPGTPMAPAFVLLTQDEWRSAVAPFRRQGPVLDGGWSSSARFGPPGWSIWAQLASRSGEMILGGRDHVGFPAVPVATPDGDIGFAPVAGASSATTPLGGERGTPPDRSCRLVLSRAGSIVCSSQSCGECLHAASLTSWYSMISCMCRSTPADQS